MICGGKGKRSLAVMILYRSSQKNGFVWKVLSFILACSKTNTRELELLGMFEFDFIGQMHEL